MKYTNPIMLSELIIQLQDLLKFCGDMPVSDKAVRDLVKGFPGKWEEAE